MKKIVNSIGILIFVIGIFSVQTVNSRTVAKQFPNSVNIALQDRNSITGFVFNESRTPLSDMYVELLTDYNSTISRTKTNGSGSYNFFGLSEGRYIVKVSNYTGGYIEQSRSVSLIQFSIIAGRGAVSEQVDFYLKVKKDANSGPLAAPGVVFVQEVPENARKLYESGIEDIINKNEKAGFTKLKSALEIFPNYFLALERLGSEYVIRGYYSPAFVLLTRAIEVNPKSFSSLFGLGLATYRLKQIDKSIEYLKLATEVYNKSASAYFWLGIAFHENGNLPQSEIALIQANKLSKGENPEIHWQLAKVYKDQKRFRESADELELWLKRNSKAENAQKVREIITTLRQKKDG